MSESDPSARPRQLTAAGGFVIAASVILVVAAFDAITNLHSVDTRDQVTKMLSSPTGRGLGITVAQALSGMRVGLVVASACAAATAVLGVFVLRRHPGARIALSILAVPILLTAPLTGGLLGVVVAIATVTLWTGPARDWFAGRPVRQPVAAQPRTSGERRPEPGRQPTTSPRTGPAPPADPPTPGPSTTDLSTDRPSSQPPAMPGYGQRPVPQNTLDPWRPAPPGPGYWPPPATGVPAPVKVACVLTWVFAGLVALVYAGLLVALAVAHDDLVALVVRSPEWQRSGLQTSIILPVLWLGCVIFFAWSVGAVVLAWFTWRRHNWARYLLAGSAGAALVAALFAFPVGFLHQLACALTIAGLFSARSREWFSATPRGDRPQTPQDRPPVW